MVTASIDYWGTEYYHKALKEMFGNKKNYQRYLAELKWNLWNNWLISLGYTKEL